MDEPRTSRPTTITAEQVKDVVVTTLEEMPKKRTHDDPRHGTTSLFAALTVADGTVISSIHRRHRAVEFKKLLAKIDTAVPDELAVHVICDTDGTHKHPSVTTLLAKHPRFHMHYTPKYSSWINQVERLFAEITRDLLQRSDHHSVQKLEADLRTWAKSWNEPPIRSSGPKPPTRSSSPSDDF